MLDTSRLSYIGNGTTLRIDRERCVGCGLCLEVCPHAVLAILEGKVRVDSRERCMECGACRMNCPRNAIEVTQGVGCVAAIVNGLRKPGGHCECSTGGRKSTTCG
jgi:ferredoxin